MIDPRLLRRASFRGHPFDYLDTEAEAGQRYVEHTFPQRDGAYHEPMGALARTLKTEAIFVGADHAERRDALLRVCERPGPGAMLHPRFGARLMVCRRATARFSTREQNVSRVALEFAADLGAIFPTVRRSPLAALLGAADAARAALQAAFEALYALAALRDYMVEAAAELVGELVSLFDPLLLALPPAAAAEVGAAVGALASDAAALVRAPVRLGSRIGLAFAAVAIDGEGRSRAWSTEEAERIAAALRGFGALAAPAFPTATAHRQSLAAALRALAAYGRRAALVEEVEVARRRSFASYQEAAIARDDLAARLDAEILDAGDAFDDAGASALAALRAQTIRDLVERGATLRPLTSLSPPASTPSLALAHRLYGDEAGALDRAAEIARRNRIRHPGFLPGGAVLEALAPEARA